MQDELSSRVVPWKAVVPANDFHLERTCELLRAEVVARTRDDSHDERVAAVGREPRRIEHERHVELRSARILKIRGQHADDLELRSVQLEGAADGARIAAEQLLPEVVAGDDDIRTAWCGIVRAIKSAELRAYRKESKE